MEFPLLWTENISLAFNLLKTFLIQKTLLLKTLKIELKTESLTIKPSFLSLNQRVGVRGAWMCMKLYNQTFAICCVCVWGFIPFFVQSLAKGLIVELCLGEIALLSQFPLLLSSLLRFLTFQSIPVYPQTHRKVLHMHWFCQERFLVTLF